MLLCAIDDFSTQKIIQETNPLFLLPMKKTLDIDTCDAVLFVSIPIIILCSKHQTMQIINVRRIFATMVTQDIINLPKYRHYLLTYVFTHTTLGQIRKHILLLSSIHLQKVSPIWQDYSIDFKSLQYYQRTQFRQIFYYFRLFFSLLY